MANLKAAAKATLQKVLDLKPVKALTLKATKTLAQTIVTPGASYTISKPYDLAGSTLVLPHAVTLTITGSGSIANGTLVGDASVIVAHGKVFTNVTLRGTWSCVGDVRWWAEGCDIPESDTNRYFIRDYRDETDALQQALDSPFRELHFPPRPYYITRPLVLRQEKHLVLHGPGIRTSMEDMTPSVRNTTILFTNLNTPLLIISPEELNNEDNTYPVSITIEGGNFDVSRCYNYTSSCIKVMADDEQKIWGLHIRTTLHAFPKNTAVAIDINPVENTACQLNQAFVTDIHIDSAIYNFDTAVVAHNYMNERTCQYYNWCTALTIDGTIDGSRIAVVSNVEGTDVRALLQAGLFFDRQDNQQPLVRYTGTRAAIASDIYDIQLGGGNLWRNQYALEVTNPSAVVTPYGTFASFVTLSKRLGKTCVNGPLY